MIALNYTSFTSPQVATKILAAMQEVKATGNAVRVLNRRGKAFLLVTIHKDSLGYAFKFIAEDGTEVGKMIQRASNVWDNAVFCAYWALLSFAWDLKEHPLLTLQKEAAKLERLKEMGATHVFITYGGFKQYGGYQRDWLGRKRPYLLCDSRGRVYGTPCKMTKEAQAFIARIEVLS